MKPTNDPVSVKNTALLPNNYLSLIAQIAIAGRIKSYCPNSLIVKFWVNLTIKVIALFYSNFSNYLFSHMLN